MHPRVCLNQVGFLSESMGAFIAFAREIGVASVVTANPLALGADTLGELREALAPGGVSVDCLMQPFARYPDLECDDGGAAAHMLGAIKAAAAIGAPRIYIVSGGRGGLDWESAAARCAQLLAPCRAAAQAAGVELLVETANLLNADIHIAHTLDDTMALAELSGIGLCLDVGAIWTEARLREKLARAVPNTGLVQLCDWVPGDRASPCKSVPGDGIVPLKRIVGDLLDLGYAGVFDLELAGARIAAEGHRGAFRRAAENLSEILVTLGA